MDGYSALIRTFNSERTLGATLCSLNRQTIRPEELVFVDSGSTDGTLACIPPGARVHKYVGAEFNYSEALNQGVKLVSKEYVLIISSHTALENALAVQYAIDVLGSSDEIGAAYFCHEKDGPLRHDRINKRNFDGFNGLWNTCSLIKVPLLKERGFRTEVFSAEDQEWARWLFCCKNGAVGRISGAGMTTQDPRHGWMEKKLNEYVAIAYFARRELLGPKNMTRIVWTVLKPVRTVGLKRRVFYVRLFGRLLACHLSKPKYASRFF
jgi:glycosyltransferase involved in cell wall biosynthesis